ncbi:MAG: hypothetical protein EXR70_18815 [Deltaproteobacteria bacterium]|nr:hypothetical protein [Deltaproteobacteria bacterium]
MEIGYYTEVEVHYTHHDFAARHVAASLAEMIVSACFDVEVEHIGSTAVTGCAGKGIVDLLVLYPSGSQKAAREGLDQLGFQRHSGADSFPESRPMRVGVVEHLGRLYRIHVHVVEAGSREARDMARFRDILRESAVLRRAYEMEKCRILAQGISNGAEYADAKGEFIRRVLQAYRF